MKTVSLLTTLGGTSLDQIAAKAIARAMVKIPKTTKTIILTIHLVRIVEMKERRKVLEVRHAWPAASKCATQTASLSA